VRKRLGVSQKAIDQIVRREMKRSHVPGMSVAVVQIGKPPKLGGYGVKKLGTRDAVTADTLFGIGSVTKSMTVAAIGILADDGKLDWDDPVRKHLDFFRLNDPLGDANVTIRDLLCHRTGLSRHDNLWFETSWSREDIVRKIAQLKPTHSFRHKFEYNNLTYATAGMVVERVSGMSWEEFVKTRLFDPLGMEGATFSTRRLEKHADHAWPHAPRSDGRAKRCKIRCIDSMVPAGAVNASARQMAQWLAFQLGEGMIGRKRIISKKNHQVMHTPQMVFPIAPAPRPRLPAYPVQVSYCLGWFLQDHHGLRMLSHGGWIGGFVSHVVLFPDQGFGVCCLSNVAKGSPVHVVSKTIADAVLGFGDTDWTALARKDERQVKRDEAKRKREDAKQRKSGTRTTLPLTGYAGEYNEPAYGPASIRLEKRKLWLHWNNHKSTLNHYQYDIFKVASGDHKGEKVAFRLDEKGAVAEMKLFEVTFAKAAPVAAAT
jgi:CubicO group peptidase (beta-lactamase class C family)